MADLAVEIKASTVDGSRAPVEPSIGNIVHKPPIEDERLTATRIPLPICALERLQPGLLSLGHLIVIDQCIYQWNGVSQLDPKTKLELSIPNLESSRRKILRQEEIDCAEVVFSLTRQDLIQDGSDARI